MFVSWHNQYDCKCARNHVEIFQVLSEQVHSQYLSICNSISMVGVALDHFLKFKPSTITMAKFYSRLSDGCYQYSSTTITCLWILIRLLLSRGFVASFLITMLNHTDGFTKKYHCSYSIYLLSCIALEFCIIIDIAVSVPGHRWGGGGVVSCMNARDKFILKLAMAKLLNYVLIHGGPNFFNFLQVHENKEDQAAILAKKINVCYLYFILEIQRTINYKKNKSFPPIIITSYT